MCDVSDPLLSALLADFCRTAVADDEAEQGMAKAERLFRRLRRQQSEESAYDAAGVGLADRRGLRAYRAMTAALEALRLNLARPSHWRAEPANAEPGTLARHGKAYLAISADRVLILGLALGQWARLQAANQNSKRAGSRLWEFRRWTNQNIR